MRRVALLTSTFAKEAKTPLELLKKEDLEIRSNPYGRKVSASELAVLAQGAVGVIAGLEEYSAGVLKGLPSLRVISRCGIGLDNVDMMAARRMGIKVYTTPDAVTSAVAELTLGFMLSLLRKVGQMDRRLHAGKWSKEIGYLLARKRVGIIGLGRVGSQVAELLTVFKSSIAFTDSNTKIFNRSWTRKSLQRLLAWADIVTLHCWGQKNGRPLLGAKELGRMKKGAWLINTSRGNLVDEKALYAALKTGKLSGAALDVFAEEPYHGKLSKLENVVLTPHIGSYAKEARIQMELEAARNLIKGLQVSTK